MQMFGCDLNYNLKACFILFLCGLAGLTCSKTVFQRQQEGEKNTQYGPEGELETGLGTCVYKSAEQLNYEEERSESMQGLQLIQ